jgi:hypothetical protein
LSARIRAISASQRPVCKTAVIVRRAGKLANHLVMKTGS